MIGPVFYEVDPLDTLTAVGGDWAQCATVNGAPSLARGIEGRSLWDFVSGDAVRHVYLELLTRVRAGKRISFPFRCDAPDIYRLMSMTMRRLDDGGVRFESETIAWAERVPLQPASTPELLRICSWCKRVFAGGEWRQPEFAIEALSQMTRGCAEPAITHGICPGCAAILDVQLEALRN